MATGNQNRTIQCHLKGDKTCIGCLYALVVCIERNIHSKKIYIYFHWYRSDRARMIGPNKEPLNRRWIKESWRWSNSSKGQYNTVMICSMETLIDGKCSEKGKCRWLHFSSWTDNFLIKGKFSIHFIQNYRYFVWKLVQMPSVINIHKLHPLEESSVQTRPFHKFSHRNIQTKNVKLLR